MLSIFLLLLFINYNSLLKVTDNRIIDRITLYDPLHNILPIYNWNYVLSIITNLATIFIVIENLYMNTFIRFFLKFIIISYIRLICIYLVPLDIPKNNIHLKYYPKIIFNRVGVNYKYDYFFSGHTSLLILCILNSYFKITYTLSCIIVIYMLVSQRVHYTIDILIAPFIVYTVNDIVNYIV